MVALMVASLCGIYLILLRIGVFYNRFYAFLPVYDLIGSFCSESVDFWYFQLSEELPSAKLQKHTKTLANQGFELLVPGDIASG